MRFIQAPDDHPEDVMNRVCDVLAFVSEALLCGETVRLTLSADAQRGLYALLEACIGSLKRLTASR